MQNKKNKKMVTAVIIISLLVLAVLIAGSLFRLRNKKNAATEDKMSETSVEDLTSQKEDAISRIEKAQESLPEEDIQTKKYVEQAVDNIRKAESKREIEKNLEETLKYLDSKPEDTKTESSQPDSGSSPADKSSDTENDEDEKYENDGNGDYVKVINDVVNAGMTEEQIESYKDSCIPVKDPGHHIKNIATLPYFKTDYSYMLPLNLGTYCKENNIAATEGEYIAYGEYGDRWQSFYLQLNDPEETVLYTTFYNGIHAFEFENAHTTKEEVLKMVEEKMMEGDAGDEEITDETEE